VSTTAASPEAFARPIEPAQLQVWRTRLACGFPAVQDVLADCLQEARAALSPGGIDAYLDCANALGRMGRGPEPVLAFLQEWPSVASAVGEDLLNDVIAQMQAMQKSPNSRAITPLLQSLAAVARRLLGPGPMRDYLRVVRELMQRTTVSIHGHHATFESPGLPVFLEHAPRALDVLNVAGLSRWADYGARHYQHHPDRQRDYFALKSADSRAVLQRERHGTLLVTVERQLELTLRCLWQDHAPLLSYSTGFDDSRVATPFFDAHGIALPDVYDDFSGAGSPGGLDRYRAALAHMAGHRRWSQPQVADNLSPLQRLTIECFEDARIDHLVLRQYPGLRPLLLALHPMPVEDACDPNTASCLRHRLAMLSRALLDPAYSYRDEVLKAFVNEFHACLASGDQQHRRHGCAGAAPRHPHPAPERPVGPRGLHQHRGELPRRQPPPLDLHRGGRRGRQLCRAASAGAARHSRSAAAPLPRMGRRRAGLPCPTGSASTTVAACQAAMPA
jgi:nitric oxide reductase NorD protein